MARRDRQAQVKRLLQAQLGEGAAQQPLTWGTAALSRMLLTLTAEGSIQLFLRASPEQLHMAPLERALRTIVPALCVGRQHEGMTISLPGCTARGARLLMVDEPMLVAPEADLARTLAIVWTKAVEAGDPWKCLRAASAA